MTPSQAHGLTREDETDLRILGCELIQSSGILLRLPQVAMATGQVLFQRFYYSESFVKQGMEMTSMACIALASKIEEAPRRLRDVINVFNDLKQRRTGEATSPMLLDQTYISIKNQVIKAERRLLKVLGFCVHVKHPHKFVVSLLQVLGLNSDRELVQTSWNYMNDCLRTDVFCRHTADTIAVSCIYLSTRVLRVRLRFLIRSEQTSTAAFWASNPQLTVLVNRFARSNSHVTACCPVRHNDSMSFNVMFTISLLPAEQVALPASPCWLDILNIKESDVRDVCRTILSIYARPKPDQLKLEQLIRNLRAELDQHKSSQSFSMKSSQSSEGNVKE